MNNINYEEICNQLSFDKKDIYVLVECMQSLFPNLDTTDKIIEKWYNSCFRADTFEEILDQFEPNTEINEIGHRIFILPTKKLIVIGL